MLLFLHELLRCVQINYFLQETWFNKFHIYTFRKSLTQLSWVYISQIRPTDGIFVLSDESLDKFPYYRRRQLYYLPPMESHSGGLPKVLSKLWNSSYKYAMLEQEDGWKNMMQPLICLNLRGQSCP